MKKHIYVLGTGTSHNGSACLLKDGKICVAIEKERITKIKHDGFNDTDAIGYCLNAEGITIHDVDLIVQNSNFGSFKYGNDYHYGYRPFTDESGVPIVTISHHLAHAYSTIGTCPFEEFNVLVMDGCGNAFDDCVDIHGADIPDLEKIRLQPQLYLEKDSYYTFKKNQCASLYKDFSELGYLFRDYPMHPSITKHTIGGLYGAVSTYCFGNREDLGKLMGLSPYGRPGIFKEDVFELKDGRVFVNYDWMDRYRTPARSYMDFKARFQYYADIAFGIQKEVERAILYIVNARLELSPHNNLCYSGGTALNAVANAKILELCDIKRIYIEPAAGDNGLALGCAFYGWLEVLKKEKENHNGCTCFGMTYPSSRIKKDMDELAVSIDPVKLKQRIDLFFNFLNTYENPVQEKEAIVQFNIENAGVFQLSINGHWQSRNDIFGAPTSTMTSKAEDFYEILLYPEKLDLLIRSGKIGVSNVEELKLILGNINIEEFGIQLKDSLEAEDKSSGSKIKYEVAEDYIERTARLLSEGYIIGWFQDGSEFGPRSLGRRSILADPGKKGVRDFINSQIKFREDFRPFAPSVLREDVARYFKTDRESPYMILVDEVLDEYKDKIGGVVHVNNTSRIQTVTPEWNPKYHALLKEFKKITGMSVLLNTSFNRKGMPIVETPKDAISFFLSCKLDYLVMGNYIISK